MQTEQPLMLTWRELLSWVLKQLDGYAHIDAICEKLSTHPKCRHIKALKATVRQEFKKNETFFKNMGNGYYLLVAEPAEKPVPLEVQRLGGRYVIPGSWTDLLIQALTKLGGTATLDQLVAELASHPKAQGCPNLRSTISSTLNKNRAIFVRLGRGVWALRTMMLDVDPHIDVSIQSGSQDLLTAKLVEEALQVIGRPAKAVEICTTILMLHPEIKPDVRLDEKVRYALTQYDRFIQTSKGFWDLDPSKPPLGSIEGPVEFQSVGAKTEYLKSCIRVLGGRARRRQLYNYIANDPKGPSDPAEIQSLLTLLNRQKAHFARLRKAYWGIVGETDTLIDAQDVPEPTWEELLTPLFVARNGIATTDELLQDLEPFGRGASSYRGRAKLTAVLRNLSNPLKRRKPPFKKLGADLWALANTKSA